MSIENIVNPWHGKIEWNVMKSIKPSMCQRYKKPDMFSLKAQPLF